MSHTTESNFGLGLRHNDRGKRDTKPKKKKMEKRQKKIQTTTPSNVALSLGILVDTTCQPRDGWPAPTNLVWTWISITCWAVKSSLVKRSYGVRQKTYYKHNWAPGRSLLRNKRFMLDEMSGRNASKFAIFFIYEIPKLLFRIWLILKHFARAFPQA